MYCPERTCINMCFGLVIVLANQKAHPLIPMLTMTSSMNLDKLLHGPKLLLFTVDIMSQKDATLLGTSLFLEAICGILLEVYEWRKTQGPLLSEQFPSTSALNDFSEVIMEEEGLLKDCVLACCSNYSLTLDECNCNVLFMDVYHLKVHHIYSQ